MIFETVVVNGEHGFYTDTYYETIADASDIINAFISGKNVVVHFPEAHSTDQPYWYSCREGYVEIAAYQINTTFSGQVLEQPIIKIFFITEANLNCTNFNDTYIGDNGKLRVGIYTE